MVSGQAVYEKRCAACHDHSDGRPPPRTVLQDMTATRIFRALDFGPMINISYTMRPDQREAVAHSWVNRR